jgi:2-polyprenyl-3-methyl-5-hydroxy-6-metoxy-1,4-benzoquinol methylase
MMHPMDLSRREVLPERMDDPALDTRSHDQALRGLARINRWSRSDRILWPSIRMLARREDRPLRILDIATGSADVPIALWRRSQRERMPIELAGCDISPQALACAAQRAAEAGVKMELLRLDVLRDAIPPGYDVITTCLFLHHLTDADAISLLWRAASAAGKALLVNDLRRSRGGYAAAWAGTRLLSRSPVVHTDGPLSVRAAYNLAEVRRLADAAGLPDARIERRWPFRFVLTWMRS